MSQITAEKNGQRKPFTEYAWQLMGEEHNGWKQVSGVNQPVKNEAKTDAPPTGDEQKQPAKVQPVENQASKPAENQPVKNEATGEENTESGTKAPDSGNNSTESFTELAEANLNPGTIKDYLDMNKIPFKANAKLSTLIKNLSDHLGGDIEKLKSEFAI